MMLSALFLALLITATEQAFYPCDPNAECGCSQNPVSTNARIVNGEIATEKTWSWAVSLDIAGNICGGTIISPSYILTAAHCVDDYQAYSITAYVGSTGFRKGIARSISRIYRHPQYYEDPFGQYVLNDIALLKLTSQLNLNDSRLAKVCLPKRQVNMNNNTNLLGIGWGTLFEGSRYPADTLQQVTLPYVDFGTTWCSSVARDRETQFCAGTMPYGGKDTCQGDSGGPLMMFNSENLWEVEGVVSYGQGCARPNRPGVYTRVDFYLDWINGIMERDPAPAGSSFAFIPSSGLVLFSLHVIALFRLY